MAERLLDKDVAPPRPTAQSSSTSGTWKMAYGSHLVQRNLNFDILAGEVLAIIGASGCGKSTLLRHLIGLQAPAAGRICYGAEDLNAADELALAPDAPPLRRQLPGRCAVEFDERRRERDAAAGDVHQARRAEREQKARDKLALVGLGDQFDAEPSSLSGGMKKRAAIARAAGAGAAAALPDDRRRPRSADRRPTSTN